jgi:hypothetical protein
MERSAMATNPYGMVGIAAPSAAGQGLGDLLGMQQKDETEEQRKRRLAGLPEPGQSEAVKSLFGGLNTSLGSIGGRGMVR